MIKSNLIQINFLNKGQEIMDCEVMILYLLINHKWIIYNCDYQILIILDFVLLFIFISKTYIQKLNVILFIFKVEIERILGIK